MSSTDLKAIEWIGHENGYLKVIDQSQLPHRRSYFICRSVTAVYQAIKTLKVRGAPLIGITAGYGFYLGAREIKTSEYSKFTEKLTKLKDYLCSARPTAVNLSWALERLYQKLTPSLKVSQLKKRLFQEAKKIHHEDMISCARIAKNGARLIKNNYGILTYCNTGILATGGLGTALAIIYQAKKEGKKFQLYIPETRPLLQGARLSGWELLQKGITPILVCDNMVGRLMQEGKINIVLVGADRIAANGDTANKIGTYTLAILAHYHKIPFYVVAPSTSFDQSLKDGTQIPIEYRSENEVTTILGKRVAPEKVKVYNPAFDITPRRFITGIITETGIMKL